MRATNDTRIMSSICPRARVSLCLRTVTSKEPALLTACQICQCVINRILFQCLVISMQLSIRLFNQIRPHLTPIFALGIQSVTKERMEPNRLRQPFSNPHLSEPYTVPPKVFLGGWYKQSSKKPRLYKEHVASIQKPLV